MEEHAPWRSNLKRYKSKYVHNINFNVVAHLEPAVDLRIHHGKQNHFLQALDVVLQSSDAIKSHRLIQSFRFYRFDFAAAAAARFQHFLLRVRTFWRLTEKSINIIGVYKVLSVDLPATI